MQTEPVEIYSDATNAAIMRHPGRKLPGVLIQGDTLYILYRQSDRILGALKPNTELYDQMEFLKDDLRSFVEHYKNVLTKHDIPLPFFEG